MAANFIGQVTIEQQDIAGAQRHTKIPCRRRYFYDDLATLIGFDSFLLLLTSGKQQV